MTEEEAPKGPAAQPSAATETAPPNERPSPTPPTSGTFATDLTGSRFGRYQLRRFLGTGGMGSVYVAHDTHLERNVALKLLKAPLPASSRPSARLLREAQALAKLNHPNVVAVHDVDEVAGRSFIAMELVEGRTLRQWLQAKRRTLHEILDVFLQAARGLAAAHGAGLVHRDFKPENALVGDDGRVRVLDFGLARAVEEADAGPGEQVSGATAFAETVSRPGVLAGTPSYMSPEHLELGQTDARSDQWSFSVALWEALYGTRPFEATNLPELKQLVLSGGLPSSPNSKGVPVSLHRTLLRGLARDKRSRFADMNELIRALERVRHQRRRRATLAATAAAAICTVGIALAMPHLGAERICRGANTDGVWDAARRAELERIFQTNESSSIRYALDIVTKDLDAWSAAWIRARQETCEATRVRHEESETLLELRMECLDARLDEARSTVEALARGAPDVLASAARMTESLGSPSGCASWRLANVSPLPADPRVRSRIAELEESLGNVRVLLYAERWVEGAKLSEQIVGGAREAGYAPLLARALVIRSRFALEVGARDEARTTAQQAMVAAQLGRDDDAFGRAAIGLAQLCNETKQYAEAHHLLELANAAVHRATRVDPDFEFARLLTLELTLYRENNFEASLHTLERACSVAEQSGNELQLAACSVNLSYTLSTLGHNARALAADERALQIEKRLIGPDSPNVADRLAEMAALELALGRKDEAFADAQRAAALREHAKPENVHDVADSSTLVGQILLALGRPTEARIALDRGLSLGEQVLGRSDPDLTNPLQQLATLEQQTGHYEAARTLLDRAIAINEGQKNESAVAELIVAVAELERTRNKAAAALAALDRAQVLMDKLPVRPLIRAHADFLRGAIEWQRGDHAAGLKLVRGAREIMTGSDESYLNGRIAQWLSEPGRDL